MASTLLQLPLELRQRIYHYAFGIENNSIKPIKPRSHNKRREWLRSTYPLFSAVSLLQTSRQVYEESTSILYGDYSFVFDDIHDPETEGSKTDTHIIVREPEESSTCDDCEIYRRKGDRPYVPALHFSVNFEPPDLQGYIHLPRCDITEITDWLEQIGTRNRSLIRRVHFKIIEGIYDVPLPHEIYVEMARLQGRENTRCLGGNPIAAALHYFDEHLEVREIEFSCDPLPDDTPNPPYARDWYDRRSERVIVAMQNLFDESSATRDIISSMKSLKKLVWKDFPPDMEKVMRSIHEAAPCYFPRTEDLIGQIPGIRKAFAELGGQIK
ncbi:uncharacterized protein KY384_006313 [Bacidia gigantensis]|uniref:uncharacterized protein n=1 Tax=Bacidia gigantensis TaxID=2732470 RepID=UPI001D038852|nr:uncharacterized protein KY384_006313 [Bacidia gigantensis]KAG8528626.1 hypothetical protein KY384_006313 [Bacidia gigantensis]